MKPLFLSSFSLLGKRKGFVLANQRHGLDSIANRSLLAYIFFFFHHFWCIDSLNSIAEVVDEREQQKK